MYSDVTCWNIMCSKCYVGQALECKFLLGCFKLVLYAKVIKVLDKAIVILFFLWLLFFFCLKVLRYLVSKGFVF